jgi:D-glycero-alpha-D-manno-heptose-7-phosphate kinase
MVVVRAFVERRFLRRNPTREDLPAVGRVGYVTHMKPAKARAPTRIDLAGGTLDIWPLYLLFPGAMTVNLAVDLPARVRIAPRADGRVVLKAEDLDVATGADGVDVLPADGPLPLHRAVARHLRPDGGFTMTTRATVPRGSGLGGSSTLAVAALRALSVAAGRRLSRPEILPIARDLEAAILGIPTGVQDHIAAAYGGLSALHLGPGAPEREELRTDLKKLARHLVLTVAGASRLSATTNWEMVKAALDDRGDTRARFREIVTAARDLREALLGNDLEDVAAAMEREYAARRGLAEGVETGKMRELRSIGRRAGSLAAKVCGAGGGGAMLFVVPTGRKGAVADALAAAGATVLPVRPDAEGLVG